MLSKSRVKDIQSLYHKKYRDESKRFVVEGPKIVHEIITNAPDLISDIYATPNWSFDQQIDAPVHGITDAELKKISSRSTPNQVLAVVKQKKFNPVKWTGQWTLMLDDIQDPGNLGTIIRLADWFGISDIICSTGCVDNYNPKVVQSTMGSIFRVNLQYTNLEEWCGQNTEAIMYAATLNGNQLPDFNIKKPGIIVIGNESKGIRKEILDKITYHVTIPAHGEAESLNAAVATGILLYHFVG